MVKIDKIQQAIMRLNGGTFQQIMDEYLYRKYKFTNITRLGSKIASSKTTKGTPDTYVELENGKYILIMYGTVEESAYSKLKQDIIDAYNIDKTYIDESKIKKVICCYTSNNININQREELKKIFKNKEVELIGIDDFSYDIAHNFQAIANTYLDISVDSGQFCDIDEFIKKHDKNSINAPLDIEFLERKEKRDILKNLEEEEFILLIGKAGIGKTKLAVEVCKEYTKIHKEIKCFCIKNNGNDIYDDLVDYIENDNKYLIFIDDINEMHRLKTFMDFINDKKENCEFKIIATVRDYVLENVMLKLKEFYMPKIYVINCMEDNQIKKIIEDIYLIKNLHYQEKILEVANGNPRIAVLAAKGIAESKIKNLNSVIDIFQSYYFPIIKDKSLTESDILILFLISLIGPIGLDNDKVIEIINKFGFDKKVYIKTIQELSKLELVDYYEEKATKISDQNFGNYIIYKVLIEDKTITISNLIEKLYPNCILKIIDAINMIYSIFYDKNTEEYILSEIKYIWDKEPYSSDSKFLYHFYNVDRTKAIKMIKDEIDNEVSKEINLVEFDFNSKKNNQRIDDKKIEILSNFKYGDLNSEAIELLIKYYKKRTDLLMDFYFGFILNLGIDEHSMETDFKTELKIIDIFMKEIFLDDKSKYAVGYLLIKIIENFLECEHYITKQTRKKLTINYIRITLLGNESVFNFRKKLFESLGKLYKFNEFKEIIEDILLKYNIYPSDEETEKIFVKDIEVLCINFFAKWIEPDFIQCEILKKFKNKCKKVEFETPRVLEQYNKNKHYNIINALELERDFGEDWNIAQQDRKDRVINMIKEYTMKDFCNLFSICRMAEKFQKKLDMFNISNSILDIFYYLIDNKKDEFLDIFAEYLNNNAPFIRNPDILIYKILSNYKKSDILSILENNANRNKHCYLSSFHNIMTDITNSDIENIFKLLDEQVEEEQVYVIDIVNLLKYEEVRKGTIEKYCEKLIKLYNKSPFVISKIFSSIYNIKEEELEYIISSFDNIEVLENLYIISLINLMDNKGKLGIAILKKDDRFIYKIIDNMRDFRRNSFEVNNIFNEIWKMDNYEHYINIVVDKLGEQRFIHFELKKIFENTYKIEKNIELRKELWIKEYIKNNYENKDKMYNIFDVIDSCFINKKMKYIQQFIKLNKSIDDFEKIPLFSGFSSWSGSEVPLIDKKIKFLEDLYDSISGLDYINHKDYIKSKIEILKKYKLDVKVKEYLEDYL